MDRLMAGFGCADGADALVTEWEQFRALYFNRLKSTMKQPLVDLRNVYPGEAPAGSPSNSAIT
jgi:hypothetical protein